MRVAVGADAGRRRAGGAVATWLDGWRSSSLLCVAAMLHRRRRELRADRDPAHRRAHGARRDRAASASSAGSAWRRRCRTWSGRCWPASLIDLAGFRAAFAVLMLLPLASSWSAARRVPVERARRTPRAAATAQLVGPAARCRACGACCSSTGCCRPAGTCTPSWCRSSATSAASARRRSAWCSALRDRGDRGAPGRSRCSRTACARSRCCAARCSRTGAGLRRLPVRARRPG